MTSRNPTKAERAAHARRVAEDRKLAHDENRCRDCPTRTEINPRTGLRFISCPRHRRIDRKRKERSNGKR